MLSSNSLLLTFYFVIIDIFFVLSTVLFVVVVYCVLKKSKTMGSYKYYMLYTTISSYAFDIVVGIWKPIPLFPIPALASEQFFRDYGSIAGYILFTVCLVAVTHYTLALAMAVTYRYAQVGGRFSSLQDNDLYRFFLVGYKNLSMSRVCLLLFSSHYMYITIWYWCCLRYLSA
jgi:hypothetical protein